MTNIIFTHHRRLFFCLILTFLGLIPLWQAEGQVSSGYIGSISWHPDGSSIALVNTVPFGGSCDESDTKILIIDAATLETGEIVTNDCTLASVSFSSSGEKLATTSLSGFVKIWSVADKNLVDYMDILQRVSKLQWHPNDEAKMLIQTDYSVKIRNPVANFLDGEGAFVVSRTMATIDLTTTDSDWNFSSDKVVTSTSDGKIYIWDTLIRDSVTRSFEQHSAKVNAVAWSPNYQSNLIASGDENGTILIWSAASGQVIKTITDHTGAINDLEWSPDGKNLASASADGTVKIWAVSTGTEQASFNYGAPVHAVTWKPDQTENVIAFGGEGVSGAKGEAQFQTLNLTPTPASTPDD